MLPRRFPLLWAATSRGGTGGPGSGKVESVEVHDLVPRGHEVLYELPLSVVAGVDLGDGSELGVRPEDEVDSGARPSELAGGAVPALVDVLGERGTPFGAHVQQVHEEVVGQRPRPVGEDAVPGLPGVGAEGPQAADEHRHLRGGQAQQAGPVNEQILGPAFVPGPEVVAEPVSRWLQHGERGDVGLLG